MISINEEYEIPNCDFFNGWNIQFKYKYQHDNKWYFFSYNPDNCIYLMEDEWNGNKACTNKSSDRYGKTYKGEVNKLYSANEFCKLLNNIIDRFLSD